ncbi:hypothetical protein GCM10010398_56850 [Streptomyces fimbriatus]
MPCCPPITAGELPRADAEKVAAVFKALSDPVRLRLFSKVAPHRAGRRACATAPTSASPSRPSPTA